jgi:drug/metabolite transporter (DMT)-like permease
MIGELAALLAAATWAVSAMLYRRALPHYGPHQANLYKTTAGALLIWLTLLCWPRAAPSGWRASSLATLSLSGVVGLAIGDTFHFRAMQLLGIQRTVVLFSLSPVFTLALAFAMGERLGVMQLTGAVLTILGIQLVLRQDADREARGRPSRVGILCALAAALCQSLGLLLSKVGLAEMGALAGTGVRLTAGSLSLVVLVLVHSPRAVRELIRPVAHRRLLPAVVVGTYIGVFLMMYALQHASAGITGTLLATTPIFSLCLTPLVDRAWPPLAAWLGSALAVLGVALTLTNR